MSPAPKTQTVRLVVNVSFSVYVSTSAPHLCQWRLMLSQIVYETMPPPKNVGSPQPQAEFPSSPPNKEGRNSKPSTPRYKDAEKEKENILTPRYREKEKDEEHVSASSSSEKQASLQPQPPAPTPAQPQAQAQDESSPSMQTKEEETQEKQLLVRITHTEI